MTKSGLSKSLRVHVRREKERIRREFFDIKKQQELIAELYTKVFADSQKKQAKVEPKKEAVLVSK
ncbi:MAG: hypothetical protein A3A27_02980 [Candidatus Wildermuthbacteria bacterium RIFCSPLOWO2_01_FULL_47_18]|uniref:Uncharacterized protein n=2 Tax=Candidatus Wildermuthiibacteriota TaxID=1817923 RepID=A0A1G2RGK4_9BACT|nr:MAG: hypothetical protein A3J68_02470 [Candidatus Wildermuthbacteria bacterium RIFCSPHIGHO2_02_FULL_48_16]OHA71976.1 MAG: hypothetical protein A3A27_02980 [Candidatus Wildermuthbacteria bacterium RIFCSPLOWO2_01_FULL_47_18]